MSLVFTVMHFELQEKNKETPEAKVPQKRKPALRVPAPKKRPAAATVETPGGRYVFFPCFAISIVAAGSEAAAIAEDLALALDAPEDANDGPDAKRPASAKAKPKPAAKATGKTKEKKDQREDRQGEEQGADFAQAQLLQELQPLGH